MIATTAIAHGELTLMGLNLSCHYFNSSLVILASPNTPQRCESIPNCQCEKTMKKHTMKNSTLLEAHGIHIYNNLLSASQVLSGKDLNHTQALQLNRKKKLHGIPSIHPPHFPSSVFFLNRNNSLIKRLDNTRGIYRQVKPSKKQRRLSFKKIKTEKKIEITNKKKKKQVKLKRISH